jgi:hypothetical protein
MRPAGIDVHIEHLVLDGVVMEGLPLTPGDGVRVGVAVQAGLARLLGADTTPPHAPAGAAEDAPTVPAHADPARLGDAIAHAVHQRVRDAGAAGLLAGEGVEP